MRTFDKTGLLQHLKSFLIIELDDVLKAIEIAEEEYAPIELVRPNVTRFFLPEEPTYEQAIQYANNIKEHSEWKEKSKEVYWKEKSEYYDIMVEYIIDNSGLKKIVSDPAKRLRIWDLVTEVQEDCGLANQFMYLCGLVEKDIF